MFRHVRRVAESPIFILCLIVVFGAVLRISHYRGYDHSDEMDYQIAASDLAAGRFHLPNEEFGCHASLRFLVTIPLAVFIEWSDADDFACSIPFLLYSLATIVVAYMLGRDVCRSPSAGLLLAAILAINRRDVEWALRMYPDAIQSLFFAISIWMIARSMRLSESTESRDSRRFSRGQVVCAIVAGIAFAAALNTNLISMIFLPVMCVAVLMTHRFRQAVRFVVWCAAGFAVVYVPLTIFYWIGSGHPFLEVDAVGFSYTTTMSRDMDLTRLIALHFSRGCERFINGVQTLRFYDVLRILLTNQGYLGLFQPALLCMLLGLVCRVRNPEHRRAWRLAVLWLLALYVMYEFGGAFTPIRKVPRYLHMFVIPSALVVLTAIRPYLTPRSIRSGLFLGLVFSLAFLFLGNLVDVNREGGSRLSDPYMQFFWNAPGVIYVLLLGVLYCSRRHRPKVLVVAVFLSTLFFWSDRLTSATFSHTIFGRAARSLDLPDPVYTNSWRARDVLRSFYLHDRGNDGIIVANSSQEILDAVDKGLAVVMYRKPASQYGKSALSDADTAELFAKLESRSRKLESACEYIVRQKEWNHSLPLEAGDRIRQTFVPTFDAIANRCAIRLAQNLLKDIKAAELRITSSSAGTSQVWTNAEWRPATGTVEFFLERLEFQSGQQYSIELSLSEKAQGKIRVLCTKGVDVIPSGKMFLGPTALSGDMTFSVFMDLGNQYILHQPEWNDNALLETGGIARQTFVPSRSMSGDACEIRICQMSLSQPNNVGLIIRNLEDGTTRTWQSGEWRASEGLLAFDLTGFEMTAGEKYEMVIAIPDDNSGNLRLLCTKNVDVIDSGRLSINNEARTGDLTCSLYAKSKFDPEYYGVERLFQNSLYTIFAKRR